MHPNRSRTCWKLFNLFLSGPLSSLRALQHPHDPNHARQAEAEDRHQQHQEDARQADVDVRDDDVDQTKLLVVRVMMLGVGVGVGAAREDGNDQTASRAGGASVDQYHQQQGARRVGSESVPGL